MHFCATAAGVQANDIVQDGAALDAFSQCCPAGSAIDACGVCGGTNSTCGAQLELEVSTGGEAFNATEVHAAAHAALQAHVDASLPYDAVNVSLGYSALDPDLVLNASLVRCSCAGGMLLVWQLNLYLA